MEIDAPSLEHRAEEREICCFFLPEDAGSVSYLPSCFENAPSRGWGVWCHYGGNVDQGKLAKSWSLFGRLSQADRQRLFASDGGHPQPFSRSQPLEWSSEFALLKQMVGACSSTLPSEFEVVQSWKKLQDLLTEAWMKSLKGVGVHTKLREVNSALPAFVAAKFVLKAIPESPERPSAALEAIINAYRDCGLPDQFSSQRDFSADLSRAFHNVGYAVNFAAHALSIAAKHGSGTSAQTQSALAAESEFANRIVMIRNALENFINIFVAASQRVTKELEGDPNGCI